MARKICGFLAAIALVVAPGLHWGVLKLRAAAQSSAQPANGVPSFQVDTSWLRTGVPGHPRVSLTRVCMANC